MADFETIASEMIGNCRFSEQIVSLSGAVARALQYLQLLSVFDCRSNHVSDRYPKPKRYD